MSLFACEECKTSFSDGNANNYPTIQILTLLTWAKLIQKVLFFFWSKKFLLPTCKATSKCLTKTHEDVLMSNFHCLQNSVLGSKYCHVKINKCFLFLWECACYFCIHRQECGHLPCQLWGVCACVLSQSWLTHTEMHDNDRLRPRVLWAVQELQQKGEEWISIFPQMCKMSVWLLIRHGQCTVS